MSKIPPDLTHMPPLIKQMIINETDTKNKLIQRELSRDFKCEVDKAPIFYDKLKMIIWPEKVHILWTKTERETIELIFTPSTNGYIMRNYKEDYEKEAQGDYRKAAVEKLLSVFKHSKVKVGLILIQLDWSWPPESDITVIFEEFNRILSEKPFQLRVEKLTLDLKVSQQQILSILRYLKPITLKELQVGPIMLRQGHDSTRLDFDEVVLTEQWMGLEKVRMMNVEFDVLLEKWSHLTDVKIKFPAHPTCSVLLILQTFLLKPTLKCLSVRWWNVGDSYDTTSAREYVNQFEKVRELGNSVERLVRLPYEGNNQMFIAFLGNWINIGRAQNYNDPKPLRHSPVFGRRHRHHHWQF